MSLFSALSFKKAISLIFTFRMIDRMIDRDRIYPQNFNISLDVSKLRYVNIKTSTQFAAIASMITKLSNLFRKTYIYVPSIFGTCALKSVIQKVAIANFSLIAFKILIKVIIFMPLRVIIFMPLNAPHPCP